MAAAYDQLTAVATVYGIRRLEARLTRGFVAEGVAGNEPAAVVLAPT